MHHLLLACCF